MESTQKVKFDITSLADINQYKAQAIDFLTSICDAINYFHIPALLNKELSEIMLYSRSGTLADANANEQLIDIASQDIRVLRSAIKDNYDIHGIGFNLSAYHITQDSPEDKYDSIFVHKFNEANKWGTRFHKKETFAKSEYKIFGSKYSHLFDLLPTLAEYHEFLCRMAGGNIAMPADFISKFNYIAAAEPLPPIAEGKIIVDLEHDPVAPARLLKAPIDTLALSDDPELINIEFGREDFTIGQFALYLSFLKKMEAISEPQNKSVPQWINSIAQKKGYGTPATVVAKYNAAIQKIKITKAGVQVRYECDLKPSMRNYNDLKVIRAKIKEPGLNHLLDNVIDILSKKCIDEGFNIN